MQIPYLLNHRLLLNLTLSCLCLMVSCSSPRSTSSNPKPVFLYSLYYNAQGENRYPPDGVFSEVLQQIGEDFEVRVHDLPLTKETLADVSLVLIANANDQAVPGHSPPPHVSAADIQTLTRFVEQGRGLLVMQNQDNHNVELDDMNKLLARFGIQTVNRYTDAKRLVIPDSMPVIGGLRWAYIIGNSIEIDRQHPARPRALVVNDLTQKPLAGSRDEPGILMAAAEPGRGRVVVVTDSGWIINAALNREEAGGVVIRDQDNREIIRRLTRWAGRVTQ